MTRGIESNISLQSPYLPAKSMCMSYPSMGHMEALLYLWSISPFVFHFFKDDTEVRIFQLSYDEGKFVWLYIKFQSIKT